MQSNNIAQLIQSAAASPLLAITGCLFACLFGIAHTLLPGHGKTIICGYCVGRKREPGKILFISGVTTFIHLFASAALGALAMTTSHVLVRNIVLPKLQLSSALLLLAFGIVLFISHLRGHGHHHDGHHHHHHDHADHDHHNHDTETDSPSGMDAMLQEYMAEPQPSFHRYLHLFWLGLAAGMIPCLEPFTLMLFSISLGRVGLGFVLLLSFGIGVFSTLVVLAWFATSPGLAPKSDEGGAAMRTMRRLATVFNSVYPVILIALGSLWTYSALKR